MLMLADNLTQTTPDTITNYRASDLTRGNEAETTRARLLDHRRAERQQFAAPDQALSFDPLEFGCAR